TRHRHAGPLPDGAGPWWTRPGATTSRGWQRRQSYGPHPRPGAEARTRPYRSHQGIGMTLRLTKEQARRLGLTPSSPGKRRTKRDTGPDPLFLAMCLDAAIPAPVAEYRFHA